MGLVPDEGLDEDAVASLGLPSRARRMLRLAAPCVRELAPLIGEATPRLYLGLPQLDPAEDTWLEDFIGHLASRTDVRLDEASSRTFPRGRAAALVALEEAMKSLESGSVESLLVGGVDTFLDLRVLGMLDAEGRVLGPNSMEGFIPGEGAGFILLSHAQGADGNAIQVRGAASADDPGHRYGTEPARGEGLADALQLLRSRITDPIGPVASTFAGLNGEHFDAKLWGVAQLRHKDLFAPDMALEHPLSCFGDTGAATGAILLALAATALSKGQRRGPALIWAASDGEQRGCALISGSPS